jgi:hypothetical protein
MRTISLSLKELEAIVVAAKAKMRETHNGFVDIVVVDKTAFHAHSDSVKVYAQSNWAECDSSLIYKNAEE